MLYYKYDTLLYVLYFAILYNTVLHCIELYHHLSDSVLFYVLDSVPFLFSLFVSVLLPWVFCSICPSCVLTLSVIRLIPTDDFMRTCRTKPADVSMGHVRMYSFSGGLPRLRGVGFSTPPCVVLDLALSCGHLEEGRAVLQGF